MTTRTQTHYIISAIFLAQAINGSSTAFFIGLGWGLLAIVFDILKVQ